MTVQHCLIVQHNKPAEGGMPCSHSSGLRLTASKHWGLGSLVWTSRHIEVKPVGGAPADSQRDRHAGASCHMRCQPQLDMPQRKLLDQEQRLRSSSSLLR